MNPPPDNNPNYHFVINRNILIASWPVEVRSESKEFLDSIDDLFQLVTQKKITRLLVDSGTPLGGALTELVINKIKKEIPFAGLEKIALLESTDFHWDNNLIQFMDYLKMTLHLPAQFKVFNQKETALIWLRE